MIGSGLVFWASFLFTPDSGTRALSDAVTHIRPGGTISSCHRLDDETVMLRYLRRSGFPSLCVFSATKDIDLAQGHRLESKSLADYITAVDGNDTSIVLGYLDGWLQFFRTSDVKRGLFDSVVCSTKLPGTVVSLSLSRTSAFCALVEDTDQRFLVVGSRHETGIRLTVNKKSMSSSIAVMSTLGNYVAVEDSVGKISLLDVKNGEHIAKMSIPAQSRPVAKLLFADDDRHLYIAAGDRILQCSVPELRRVHTFQMRGDHPLVDIDQCGVIKLLSTVDSAGNVAFWHSESHQLLSERRLSGQPTSIRIIPAANGALVSTRYASELVKVLDRTERHERTGHIGEVGALTFAQGGKRLVSTAPTDCICIWDTGALECIEKHSVPSSGQRLGCSNDSIALVSDASMLAAYDLGGHRLRVLDDTNLMWCLGLDKTLAGACFSNNDGRGVVRFYDIRSGKKSDKVVSFRADAIALSQEQDLFVLGREERVEVRRLVDNERVAEFQVKGPIYSLAFGSHCRAIAVGGADFVSIYELESKKARFQVSRKGADITSAALSASTLAAGDSRGVITLYELDRIVRQKRKGNYASPQEMWRAMMSLDAEEAYAAQLNVTKSPEAMRYFTQKLRAIRTLDRDAALRAIGSRNRQDMELAKEYFAVHGVVDVRKELQTIIDGDGQTLDAIRVAARIMDDDKQKSSLPYWLRIARVLELAESATGSDADALYQELALFPRASAIGKRIGHGNTKP